LFCYNIFELNIKKIEKNELNEQFELNKFDKKILNFQNFLKFHKIEKNIEENCLYLVKNGTSAEFGDIYFFILNNLNLNFFCIQTR
jgi:hypothetical protein